MGALEKYISELVEKIQAKKIEHRGLTDIEIIRIIYIDLGSKMNFDLNYTFGNSKQRKQIYGTTTSEEELNKAFEARTIICKSLSYILMMILQKFGYKCDVITERDEYGRIRNGAHVYNRVTIPNGQTFIIDLEEDLEYIQTGAKTKYFALENHRSQNPIINENTLRKIDKEVADYIPDGVYMEDIIWMLEKAISNETLTENQRFEFILDNLNKYKNTRALWYRERVLYHERIIDHFFSRRSNELKKGKLIERIDLFDCYRVIDGKREYVSCIVTNFDEERIYLFNNEENCYKCISIDVLAREIKNGLNLPDEGRAKQFKRYTSKMCCSGPEL